ncbi:Sec-independent protein translocase subunit TatA [Cryptosporangium phraense]|uniref:Sec-independent protein translocase protein TatA n=1 Tax=Cryptosporangium phraense TaxID=2593070 RepID=A0A545AF47_9ACTN|nr:Sec-independent protein translocase subunit TatA [Cryptosporangium phraense]TQS39958.1 Sec-independent protein translocase subunit TatA [Cryptosporangium phraense]
MDALSPWHLLIIAACFVMLFGAKRLPDAARSLGRSARIMKAELKGMHDEPKAEASHVTDVPAEPIEAVVVEPRVVVSEDVPVTARADGTR